MTTRALRIFIILPFYGGSLPIGRYCASALKDLGHLVEVFDSPEFFSTINAFKALRIRCSKVEELEASFLQVISEAIYAKAIEFEPDLILTLAQAPVTRQLLKRFKKDNVITAMWFVEDFTVFPYWRSFAPLYDCFFVIQKELFLEELHAIGVMNTAYLPLAALPSFHHPMELSPLDQKKYTVDVSFVGAGYPNRRLAFRELLQFQFKIWGSDWEGESILASHIQAKGVRVSSEESVKIFNATRVNINLHSSVKTQPLVSNGDFVNPRTFELSACNAFQCVDTRQLLAELFNEDELVTFSSITELQEKIHYFLAHPDERKAISERSRKRVLAEHTYQERMKKLLSYVTEFMPNWPKEKRSLTLPDMFSKDVQADLEKMFHTLELPIDSTFDDIIIKIRQQTGVLSPLETSLLFLDEWKKLYHS